MLRSKLQTLVALAVALTASASPSIGKEIKQIFGSVSAVNHAQFLKTISDNNDNIIGLKIGVTDTQRGDRYYASGEDKMIVVSTSGDRFPGYEAVINGGRYESGGWVVDGFFLIKSGGMHQGVLSYGLTPVDEAQIRLMPGVKIKTINLKN